MKGLASILPRRSGAAICALAALSALAVWANGMGFLHEWESDRGKTAARQVTIAVAAPDPAEQATRGQTIAAMLRARSDLLDVHPVPEAIARAEAGDGPLPALIDATLAPGADDAPLRRALAGLPGVNVTRAAPIATGGLRAAAHIARIVAGLALIGALAMGIALSSAIEGAAVALLERLGASDAQIVRAVTRAALPDLVAGSLIGALLALPFIAWQARLAEGAGMAAIPLSGWAVMAAVVPAMSLCAACGIGGATWLRLRRRS